MSERNATALILAIAVAIMLWAMLGDRSSLPNDPGDCDPYERICH